MATPLLNIGRLKEKVAQSGSRVIASFKGDSSRSCPGVASAMAASAVAAVAATAAATSAHCSDKTSESRSKVSSQSSLTNDQLTAHLTAEEREILEKVDCDLRFASRSDARCVPWHSRDCLPHTHTRTLTHRTAAEAASAATHISRVYRHCLGAEINASAAVGVGDRYSERGISGRNRWDSRFERWTGASAGDDATCNTRCLLLSFDSPDSSLSLPLFHRYS